MCMIYAPFSYVDSGGVWRFVPTWLSDYGFYRVKGAEKGW